MTIAGSRERYEALKQMLEERQKVASAPFVTPQDVPELEEMRVDELERVAKALAGLEEGTYGICAGCHAEIEERRLMALPYVRICTSCDVQAEVEYLRLQKHPNVAGPLFAQFK